MADALRSISTRETAQTLKSRDDQVKNNAGGFVFKVTPQQQLRRFLILGVDGGTYYQNAPELAEKNAGVVIKLAKSNPTLLVNEIIEVATKNLAPRANPTLFALAVAVAPDINTNVESRRKAFAALPEVARTATQLFIFLNYAQQFRGWGPAMREAVSNWYLHKSASRAAYQVVKYRQREGWTHRDVIRQAHPDPKGEGVEAFKSLFDYVCGREADLSDPALRIVEGYEKAKTASISETVKLISEYKGLSWEMLNNDAIGDADVWRALIDAGMPYTALMRNLPKLTGLGVLTGNYLVKVVKQLSNPEIVAKSGVHPMSILFALTTYSSGHGFRGSLSWRPVSKIVDALDAAFYLAFKNVQPSNGRFLLALDVSGSMMSAIMNSCLSARQASVAMAMITAATEPHTDVIAFTSGGWSNGSRNSGRYSYGYGSSVTPVNVSPRRRLDDNVRATDMSFGGTDCALPMLYAAEKNLEVDTFVIYTDNETWAGSVHPYQALRQYRNKSGINAKLVVVGMTSTGFSIADPTDAGMLDVVGFDASAPAVISDFARS